MKRLLLIVGLTALSCGLAAGVWARNSGRIVGTTKNDVLKGTARADVIDGRAGNDRLAGRAGNDVLIGGPGKDRLVGGPGKDVLRCGPGKDTAVADAADAVSSDCEVVSGRPAAEPPPAPAPTPPAPTPQPPAPPPPPAATARAGHYCGFTNQGKSICFDVTAGGTRVANFETTSDLTCGDLVLPDLALSFGDSTALQSDLTFSFTYNGPIQTPPGSAVTNVMTSYTVSGKLDTAGNGTGTLSLARLSFDFRGTHIDCAAAPYGWQARLGA
jgi:RTX calcium-binding nonapeptide repeat (4 copies)